MDTGSPGGRKPRVTDDEILGVFVDALPDDPVLSTAEVADQLTIQRRGTLTRLENLEAAGQLHSKTIGGRNRVWWVPELGLDLDGVVTGTTPDPATTPSEPAPARDAGRVHIADTGSSPGPTETEAPTNDRDRDPPDPDGQADNDGGTDAVPIADRAREIVDGLDVDWDDQRRELGADTLAAAYYYLQEEKSAKKSDFLEDVMPDHRAGYPPWDGEGRFRGGWWRTLVSPGLEQFDDVFKPDGGGAWQYTGDTE